MTPAEVLLFTKELSDLLYRHITDEMFPELRRIRASRVFFPESHAETYDDIYSVIWSRVMCFLGIINRWLYAQGSRRSNMVALALTDSEAVEKPVVPEDTGHQTAGAVSASHREETRAAVKKESIRILVEMLVMRIFKKSKVELITVNEKDIVDHLTEKIWTQVRGTDFVVTPETVKYLHRAVYKALHKDWGCAEMVLASLRAGEPEIEEYITFVVKVKLTEAKRPSAVSRFFSSIGRAVSGIFRPGNRAVVI